MINSFHMNPWLYLLAIPISAIIVFITLILRELTNIKYIIFIFILLLLLLVYLYINIIIGLFDLIALVLIFSINFYLNINISSTEQFASILISTSIILPILATITSFIYNLN